MTLSEELIAVLDDLVSAADEVHVVREQELGDDVGSKPERQRNSESANATRNAKVGRLT